MSVLLAAAWALLGRVLSPLKAWLLANALGFLVAIVAILSGIVAVQHVKIAGVHVWKFTVAGLEQKLTAAQDQTAAAQAQVKAKTVTITREVAARATEQTQDRGSYAALSQACDKRVTTARTAAAKITEIINAPRPKPQPTPVPSGNSALSGGGDPPPVDAGSLRIIAGQADGDPGPGGTGGVPAGGDGTPRG